MHSETIEVTKKWTKVMSAAERDAEDLSIELTDEYKHKYDAFRKIMEDYPAKVDDWEERKEFFLKESQNLENSLMSVEVRLIERLRSDISNFEAKMKGLNTSIDEKSYQYSSNISNEIEKFRHELQEHVTHECELIQSFVEKFEEQPDLDDPEAEEYLAMTQNEEIKAMYDDPEAIGQMFDQMKEYQE